MKYIFYAVVCLGLILFQTTIVPNFRFMQGAYDFLIPLVLYLGLYRPFSEGLVVVSLVGFCMDSLSGAPFGLYLTVYVWLFAIVRWISIYLHVANSTLLPFLVAVAVLIENGIFAGALKFLTVDSQRFSLTLRSVSTEVIWAVITGPIYLLTLSFAHKKLDRWWAELAFGRSGQTGR